MSRKIKPALKHIKKILFSILRIFILIYFLFLAFLYFFQNKLIYFPDDQDFDNCFGFQDYQKINFQDTRFYFLEKTKDVIVFYHGNAGSACDRYFLKQYFEKSEKSIIFVEYAGYSNDTKSPSKKLILNDVENIQDFLQQKKFTQVTVFGESIGTGMASYHASIGGVDKLFLISPFSSLADVAKARYMLYPIRIILKENYDNVAALKNYTEELLIIHGGLDRIIPIHFAEKLFESIASEQKRFVKIDEARHNDLYNFEKLGSEILNFIK